jgi:hypothetical protein
MLNARSDSHSWFEGVDVELCDALDEADVELVKVRPVYDAAMARYRALKACIEADDSLSAEEYSALDRIRSETAAAEDLACRKAEEVERG